MPFASAASELVDETLHPLAQLEQLELKARDLQAESEIDGIIECRIKQLSLQNVMVMLYDFPLMPLLKAEVALAEAYASGGFFRQAREHLTRSREGCTGIPDEVHCKRLQADLQIAEGVLLLGEGQHSSARDSLKEARRLTRSLFGESDVRMERISILLAQLAQQRTSWCESEVARLEKQKPGSLTMITALRQETAEQRNQSIESLQEAWAVREQNDGEHAEETIRLLLRVAEAEYEDDRRGDAIQHLAAALEKLQKSKGRHKLLMLVDASSQMAKWLEAQGDDDEALRYLDVAEQAAIESLAEEDAKAVEIRRDKALLHVKLGSRDVSHYDNALQYLNDVHYYERRLHGSQSTNVARTLKALATVHMARSNFAEAEQCLHQALHIFKVDLPQHAAVVRDIHAKLKQIEESADYV